ncbi:MFS transporter [Microbacterium sp. MYb64]|uniref:MFS transporter n=1 Tax=Microbacterium sp. MYb64 TaxID=1848691 RepID=UPI0021575310|nr:MFS transporter [Microbacterium sp. MYb64]
MSASTTRPKVIVAVLAFAGIASSLTQTMVTPLIARFPEIFDSSAANTAWIVTVTLLAAAVAVPIAGRLGDLFGKKRMILIVAIPLILGGIVCALAPTVEIMIVGRALQGLGSGMVPLGIALLRDVVPREQLSSAIATVSATLGVGGAIGLPLSAAVVQFADWRVLFLVGSAVTVIAAAAIWILVPATPAGAAGQRFDGLGALGLALGLVSFILAISKGAEWGWGSPSTIGLLALAALSFAGWGVWETRVKEPLVDLRTTVRPRVLLTNIASIFVGFGMYASMLVMPQVLQLPAATGYGLGQSILAAGLWMAPAGLMMLLLSPVAGRLIDARGPKFTLVIGVVILAAGYGVGLVGMGSTWGLLVTSLVINSGVAFAYGSMPAIIMGAVPRSETAAANGFNTLMRSLGTTIGAAVIGVILAQMTIPLGDAAVPSEAGFRTALIIGAGVSIAAAVVALFIPDPARRTEGAAPAAVEADAEAETVAA